MKKFPALLMCLAHLLVPAGASGQQPARKAARPADALWLSVTPARDRATGERGKYTYFDLQRDGRFIYAEGDDFASMTVVRSGLLPAKLVRRAFDVVSRPSVFMAHDTDPGEPFLSDSDWVGVGLMTDGEVKASGGWLYQEELKDFPAEFRQLLVSLKSAAGKLPKDTAIKALLSAAAETNEWRINSIGRDRFIVLDDAALEALPALKQAIATSRRMVAVEGETQMRRFAELARKMNPQATIWGLYQIKGRGFYEVYSHPQPAKR